MFKKKSVTLLSNAKQNEGKVGREIDWSFYFCGNGNKGFVPAGSELYPRLASSRLHVLGLHCFWNLGLLSLLEPWNDYRR